MKTVLFFFIAAWASAAWPSVGPDYARPAVATPGAYRDAAAGAQWKPAAPADQLERGRWWELFGDSRLTELETQALQANQDLSAAAARVEQANAAAGAAHSQFWPQAAANAAASRERYSATTANPFPQATFTDYSLPVIASWELDLFGRVRRLNEGTRADAQASAALYESVQLSLTANVAATYFSLQGLERESAVIDQSIALRDRELKLVAARRRIGSATELDTARAETELATAEAEAEDLAVRRSGWVKSLSILEGQPANRFDAAVGAARAIPPVVPAGLPSDLLERRPDVAAAERSLAAANARVGVAKAAFFPTISLTGSSGVESADTGRLLSTDSRVWAFGPSVYLPLFQGGRNRANLARSRAVYAEQVAVYRQQVLTAVAEVQDALTAIRHLELEAGAQERALATARLSAQLAQRRYDTGYVSYLEVIDAQRTALATERASVELATQRMTSRVTLIKALGGTWK